MLRREAEKSQQLSGKLLVRVRRGEFPTVASGRRQSIVDNDDEVVCTVEFDGKVSSCSSTITFETEHQSWICGQSFKDAVLDVPEYHGASPITIGVGVTKSNNTFGRRSSRLLRIFSSTKQPSALSSKGPKRIAETTIPLRDALPKAQRNFARQIADSYEGGSVTTTRARLSSLIPASKPITGANKTLLSSSADASSACKFVQSAGVEAGWWNGYGGVSPENWWEYWPEFTVPIGQGTLTISVIFVPIIPPDRALGGFTELHKAAYIGDSGLVRVLLGPRCGSNLYFRTRDALNLSALDIAALKGHVDVVLEMITDSSQLSSWIVSYQSALDKRTSLHYAVLGDNPLVVSYLAGHYGSSVYATIKRPHSHSSRSFGSSLDEANNDELHGGGGSESVRCLVMDIEDENGWTALMMACERPDMAEAVSRLVEAGANPEITNKAGDTALVIACSRGNVDCAIAVLEAKASSAPPESKASLARPNRANHAGDRALDRAAGAKPCPELIRALLDACAVPGLRRCDGSTALHVAAHAGYTENCKALIEWLETERDAMEKSEEPFGHFVGSAIAQSLNLVLIKDSSGRLASDCALSAGHGELAQWLKEVETRELARRAARKSERGSTETYDYYKAVNAGSDDDEGASNGALKEDEDDDDTGDVGEEEKHCGS